MNCFRGASFGLLKIISFVNNLNYLIKYFTIICDVLPFYNLSKKLFVFSLCK